MNKLVSIVIPAHNEEENIIVIVDRIEKVFESLNYNFEIFNQKWDNLEEPRIFPFRYYRMASGYSTITRTSSRSDSKAVARVFACRKRKDISFKEPV